MREKTGSSPSELVMILRYTASGASSRVRGIELARALAGDGTHTDILTPDAPHWRRRFYTSFLSRSPVYIQKRVSPRDAQLMRVRRALGRATIFDLDDAPGSVAEDPAQEELVAAMMRLASAVTVGGHALHAFASRYNDTVEIVPSSVDTSLYTPSQRHEPVVTIGWVGNGAGYTHELLDFARVAAGVRDQVRVRVVIVGAMGRPEIHDAFRHSDDEVIDEVDWRSEAAIVKAMQEFDIGVYPLRDTAYNAYKCGYKAIQYMALGLPVVASAVGETPYIVGDGHTGLLADAPDQWVEHLVRLATDPGQRRRLGDAGRRVVEERYSLDAAARSMRSLLERLSRRRDRGSEYRLVFPRRVDRRRLVRDTARVLGADVGEVRELYRAYRAFSAKAGYEERFGEKKTLNTDEAFVLYAILATRRPPGPIVEIGTQHGRSTRRILDMVSHIGLSNPVICYDVEDQVTEFGPEEAALRIEDLTGRFRREVIDALAPGLIYLDAHPYHLTKEVITGVLEATSDCFLTIHDCGRALCNPDMTISKDDPRITSATGHWERHVLCEVFGVDDPMSDDIDYQQTPTHVLAVMQTTHGLGVIAPRPDVESGRSRSETP